MHDLPSYVPMSHVPGCKSSHPHCRSTAGPRLFGASWPDLTPRFDKTQECCRASSVYIVSLVMKCFLCRSMHRWGGAQLVGARAPRLGREPLATYSNSAI